MPDPTPSRRLALVDGHSLLHRAYYALPPLTNAAGQPTNALYGFLSMLFRLLEDERPSHLAVALDLPGGTFRDELFEAYKGHRPPMPDDLRSQEALLKECLAVLRIPVLAAPGFEADDVIGTAARAAVEAGFDVLIVTGDRDAFQLVGPHVEVRMTRRGITEMERVDEAAVRERYGLLPEQLVDVKALMGDASDNIPGVPGIGEKTAVRLVQQFHDLEGVLAHAEEAGGPKLRQALREYADQARLSKRLATIAQDAPLDASFDDLRVRLAPVAAVRPFFLDMDFRSLLRRYPAVCRAVGVDPGEADGGACGEGADAGAHGEGAEGEGAGGGGVHGEGAGGGAEPGVAAREPAAGAAPSAAAPAAAAAHAGPASVDVRLLPDAAAWEDVLASLGRAGRVALAFVPAPRGTRPLPPAWLAAGAGPEGPVWVGPCGAGTLHALGRLQGALAGHGVKPLLTAAAYAGAALPQVAFDAELAAYLLDPGRSTYPLEDLARHRLGEELPPLAPEGEPAVWAAALARRALAAARLEAPLRAELQAMELEALWETVELPLMPVLARMEAAGICVDRAALEELGRVFKARIAELEGEIYELAGGPFNINSTQQLGAILFERLGLAPLRKTKTGYSTDAETLEALAAEHPLPAKVLEYRGLVKLQSTYVEGLAAQIDEATGRIHTTLAQTVAATGRLSSVDPNLQNIPVREELGRQLRRAFVAPPGHLLLAVDYSQIELRLLAHFSEDEGLLAAFRDAADIHRQTAAEVFGVAPEDVTPEMRSAAKAVNFGIVYGISDFGLSRNLGIPREAAHEFIQRYFERYPGVKRYLESTVQRARETGYVRTLFGRIRHLPEIHSRNFARRQYAERTAMNTPLQGTAADLIKIAMLRADRALRERGLRARMVLQVHDELIFEVPEEELAAARELALGALAGAAELRVPLVAEAKCGPNWYAMRPI
ncbi:MAG: DNA polymerase I [Firmicutes bacterium]|nr:DNA polymerase I [Bacillota bacterium]